MPSPPLIELGIGVLQGRGEVVPIVQHLLQAIGDVGGVVRLAQVAGDEDELAIARAVLIGCEFHAHHFRWV